MFSLNILHETPPITVAFELNYVSEIVIGAAFVGYIKCFMVSVLMQTDRQTCKFSAVSTVRMEIQSFITLNL